MRPRFIRAGGNQLYSSIPQALPAVKAEGLFFCPPIYKGEYSPIWHKAQSTPWGSVVVPPPSFSPRFVGGAAPLSGAPPWPFLGAVVLVDGLGGPARTQGGSGRGKAKPGTTAAISARAVPGLAPLARCAWPCFSLGCAFWGAVPPAPLPPLAGWWVRPLLPAAAARPPASPTAACRGLKNS